MKKMVKRTEITIETLKVKTIRRCEAGSSPCEDAVRDERVLLPEGIPVHSDMHFNEEIKGEKK